jgi:hypothetical protein
MGAEGFEPPAFSSGNTAVADSGGSKSGNILAGSDAATPTAKPTPPPDPDLAAIVAAWPELPPAIRAGVLALVKAAIPPTPATPAAPATPATAITSPPITDAPTAPSGPAEA